MENASGAVGVQGSYVAADKAHVSTAGSRGNRDSHEQTSDKAKRRIDGVAARLNIQPYIAESAHQIYKLALNNNFAKGRKSQHLVCACLYLACRKNRTPHMLMDFAEAICVNVFAIGSTYLQLLNIIPRRDDDPLPRMDPALYIPRITSQLDFGPATTKIEADASRLAHRMGKDWIVQGRRPAGVAAAAVLLAARMNNFRRSKAQIVSVAKIGEETVQRRLDEFSRTNAAALSVSLFRATNIESEADPPSFTRHRDNERKRRDLIAKQRQMMEAGELDESDKEMQVWANEIDLAIAEAEEAAKAKESEGKSSEQTNRGTLNEVQNEPTSTEPNESNVNSGEEGEEEEEEEEEEEAAVTGDLSPHEERVAQQALIELSQQNHILDRVPATTSETGSTSSENGTTSETTGPVQVKKSRGAIFLENYRKHKAMILAAKAEEAEEDALPVTWAPHISDDPENLEDVDDDEVEFCKLSEEEVKVKTRIWMSQNYDYIIAEEKKRLKIELDKMAGTYKEPRKRRKIKKEPQLPTVSEAAPVEQATSMIERKKVSGKLNYEKLGSVLFNDDDDFRLN